MDVLRDFAALQMLIFRAVGLANPTEQVWLILSSFSVSFSPDRAGATENAVQKVAQWAKVNGRNFALVEYQDQTPASAPRMVLPALQRCSVAVQKHTRCRSVIHLNRRSGNENKSRFILHFARFSLSLYPKTSRNESTIHPSLTKIKRQTI